MKRCKMVTILLALAVTLGLLAACAGNGNGNGGGVTANLEVATQQPGAVAAPQGERQLPPMTTDNITLTFSIWHYVDIAEYLAERFMERHPNIRVEVLHFPGAGYYMDTLLAYAAAGELPDVFTFLDLTLPVNNGWFFDFTHFWHNDPDYHYLLESMQHLVYIDGRAMKLPEAILPQLVAVDRNVFNMLNVPMPRFDWYWDEMIDLMSSMTRPDLGIFSFNQFLGPVTWGPVVLNDALSEFGWDGERYNMYEWARYMNFEAEMERLGHRAMYGSDEWEALTGDRYLWPGISGRIAMQFDASWTWNNYWVRDFIRDQGIDMVPYAIPMGRDSVTNRRPAFTDFAAISAGTPHPREAYELLKWMTFSPEAWHYRNYMTPQLLNAAGDVIFHIPNRFPATNCPDVWADFRQLFPLDEPAWDYLMAASKEPVPLGGRHILGFGEWHRDEHAYGDWNGVIGIGNAIRAGVLDAFDAVHRMEETGRAAYEAALSRFRLMFGPPPAR
ncbi:MAG: extracellular solute-binding protein [Defluviitaleaceae bacterium]|nr:extracellular solute-binding protein [Defluviitaleaceae bacterium]MCL2238921.1 extracellular solute-binding protein [Defluviitaleaceae bacterium]